MPGPAAGVFDDPVVAELTAKTLIERAVFVDLHSGHATFAASSSLIERTSFSNRASQPTSYASASITSRTRAHAPPHSPSGGGGARPGREAAGASPLPYRPARMLKSSRF